MNWINNWNSLLFIFTIHYTELLLWINNDKPPGIAHLDGNQLRMVADSMATPICHIFNLSLEEGVVLRPGGKPKSFLYPRGVKWPSLVLTADLSACCQLSANCWRKLCSTKYNAISLQTNWQQHTVFLNEGHSTCTALTQSSNDWLKDIDNTKIVGALLLDFRAAFDITDHNLLLRKHMFYSFSTFAISCIQSYCIYLIELRGISSMEGSLISNMSGVVYRRAAFQALHIFLFLQMICHWH